MGVTFSIVGRELDYDVEGPTTTKGGWVNMGGSAGAIAELLEIDPQIGMISVVELSSRLARAYASPRLVELDRETAGEQRGRLITCAQPAGRISYWLRELDKLALEAGEEGVIRWS